MYKKEKEKLHSLWKFFRSNSFKLLDYIFLIKTIKDRTRGKSLGNIYRWTSLKYYIIELKLYHKNHKEILQYIHVWLTKSSDADQDQQLSSGILLNWKGGFERGNSR